jgi:hypothetical protein
MKGQNQPNRLGAQFSIMIKNSLGPEQRFGSDADHE